MSTRSDGGAEPGGDGGDEDEGTSGNVVVRELVLAEAEEGIDIRKGDEGCRGCRGGWSWASCAPARARSTRVIEFLSKTRLRSVSPSRGRSEGEVAVWSLRRERFESQAVVSMLWNMDGTREWFSGDGKVGSGKMGGAVTELPSVVGSVSVVEDVLNDDGVWWAVAVDDEDEGQAPEVDVGSWGGLLIEPGRRIEAGASGQRGKAGGERGPGAQMRRRGYVASYGLIEGTSRTTTRTRTTCCARRPFSSHEQPRESREDGTGHGVEKRGKMKHHSR